MSRSINASSEILQRSVGTPKASNTSRINFTNQSQSGVLQSNTTYRVISNQDCHISFNNVTEGTISNAAMMISAGIPEMFSTTFSGIWLNVIQATTSGTLWYTRMLRSDEF